LNSALPPKLARNKHNLLCAGVFILVMLGGGYQIIATGLRDEGLDFPRSLQDFREGKTTQTLEKQIDKHLPARQHLITLANTVRYHVLGGGGEQVRVGKEGWLFLSDELRLDGAKVNAHASVADKRLNPEAALASRIAIIGEVSRRLEKHDVRLVLALVPDKARLYPQFLGKGGYPDYIQSRYTDALAGLTAQGVSVVNLLAAFAPVSQGPTALYYKTDTHWNQTGAVLAAREIARVVSLLRLNFPSTRYITATGSPMQDRPGDLIRLMGLEHVPSSLRPASDRESVEITQEQASSSATGLFDDAGVAVALAGTSFSLRGNFHGRLQEALATKVLNTAKDGGGFLQALSAYLKDDSFRSSKPKVLVWEVPERMLGRALDEEAGWIERVAVPALAR
jgi:alginate O-acetyltransferase complex protein AlgJ